MFWLRNDIHFRHIYTVDNKISWVKLVVSSGIYSGIIFSHVNSINDKTPHVLKKYLKNNQADILAVECMLQYNKWNNKMNNLMIYKKDVGT